MANSVSKTYDITVDLAQEGTGISVKGISATVTEVHATSFLTGPPGKGFPPGGSTGQVMTKLSNTNYDADWEDNIAAGSSGGLWGHITGDISTQADLQAEFATKADLNSPDLTGNPTAPTPTLDIGIANKAYVDAVAQGLSVKLSVVALSDTDTTLSGEQTFDTVSAVTGDRVLLVAQTDATENGIWVVDSAAWARPDDFDSASSQKGSFTFVSGGTVYVATGWTLIGSSPTVVDTDDEVWTQSSGAGNTLAGTGLSKSGNTISLIIPVSVADGGTGATTSTGTGNTVLSDSPALTGTPTAPTATGGDISTKIATTAFVDAAVTGVVPDADATTKGKLKLTGGLGGTADSPTTPTAVHLTGTETISGSKIFSDSADENSISIIPTGNTGTDVTTDGALFIDNTGNDGLGLSVYSNAGTSATGWLVNLCIANTAYGNPSILDQDNGILNIDNYSSQTAIHVQQFTELTHHQNALSVESLSSTQQTLASQGLVVFRDSSTSSTNTLLELVNFGSGAGELIRQDGNGIGLNVFTRATTQAGLLVSQTGTTGPFTGLGLARFELPSDATGVMIRTDNAGTGINFRMLQTGEGIGLDVETSAVNNSGIYVNAVNAFTSNFGLIRALMTNSSSTGRVLRIEQAGSGDGINVAGTGTGTGLTISQTQDALGLSISSAATTQSSIIVSETGAFSSSFGIVRFIAPSTATGRLLRLENAGTGDAQNIVQSGDGIALNISKTVTNHNVSANAITISQQPVVNDGNTYTKTGTGLAISSNVTQTSGTITDSAKLATFTQSNSSASGDAVTISNSGTGASLVVDTTTLVAKGGLVGIGTASPSAAIDAKASTTSAASIRVRSGSAPTSPNSGDVWFDGTHLQFRNGSTTDQIDSQTNGLTITASTGTLTITNGKTFSVAKSLTLDGTDSTTMTFPTTSATIARTDAAQTFTGVQTLSSSPVLSSGAVTVSSNTVTFPTTADTLVARATTDTLTNKRITRRVSTTSSSATPTPNGDTDDEYTVTALAAGATFGAPTGTPTEGQRLIIRIKDNGGAQTLAWNAIYRFSTDLAAPTTTIISKTLYLGFMYNNTDSKWDCLAILNNF